MSALKHVLGISGGKDSAALAIYMKDKYPSLDLTYYFTDTGKELDETYQLIERLEGYLGKPIAKLESEDARKSGQDPFDYYYKVFRGYLPSSQARWCTKVMKIQPFEDFVGDALRRQLGNERAHGAIDAALLIVGGNDDGKQCRWLHAPKRSCAAATISCKIAL